MISITSEAIFLYSYSFLDSLITLCLFIHTHDTHINIHTHILPIFFVTFHCNFDHFTISKVPVYKEIKSSRYIHKGNENYP